MTAIDEGRVREDLGRRVAELRIGRSLTQERFAEHHLHCTVQYLQRIERGSENLTIVTLVKIANALRVPLVDLFAAPASRERRPGRPRRSKQARG